MLIKLWGAEKVAITFLEMFPEADFYTLIYDESQVWKVFPRSLIHPVCNSLPTQRLYSLFKKQRLCLPLMQKSVWKIDFTGYDYVIVSSSWFAHGLDTSKNTKTLIYYHAPARYMWDWTHQYTRQIWLHKWILWYLYWRFLLKLRLRDFESGQNGTLLLSNSTTTQWRIKKYYRRESDVLYPPIETARFWKKISTAEQKNTPQYYCILSALTEFKKIDIAIKNWSKNKWDVKLYIIWTGEYKDFLVSLAKWNKNIKFLGAQYGDVLVELVQSSLWLIFPWEEDFWIVPIEFMAAWKPVFALKKWGLTETVKSWVTWDFFSDSDGSDFWVEFTKFHHKNISGHYKAAACRAKALLYDTSTFEKQIRKYIKAL